MMIRLAQEAKWLIVGLISVLSYHNVFLTELESHVATKRDAGHQSIGNSYALPRASKTGNADAT